MRIVLSSVGFQFIVPNSYPASIGSSLDREHRRLGWVVWDFSPLCPPPVRGGKKSGSRFRGKLDILYHLDFKNGTTSSLLSPVQARIQRLGSNTSHFVAFEHHNQIHHFSRPLETAAFGFFLSILQLARPPF